MLTRCPACQTAFRIRPEQLRARQGRVRCGHCGKAFNALEALLEDEALGATVAGAGDAPHSREPARETGSESEEVPALAPDFDLDPPSEEPPQNTEASAEQPPGETEEISLEARSPLFVLEDTVPEAQAQLPIPEIVADGTDAAGEVPELYVQSLSRRPAMPSWSLPETDPAPDAGATAAPEVPPTTTGGPAFDLDFEIPEDEDDDAPQADVLAVAPGAALPDEAELDLTLEAAYEEIAEALNREALPTPAETLREYELPASAVTPSGSGDPIQGLPALPLPARPAVEAADSPLSPDDEIYPFRVAPPPPPRSALWGLGVGTLLMLLAAQSTLLFRNAIVQIVPESQPLYQGLCERLGCELPLPREAGFIAIESSDLHPEAARPGTFVLSTTLQNRAAFRQAYPHLELTLTDLRDRDIARRVIAPAEWRPPQADPEGFAPGSTLEASIPFAAEELRAVGYRVYAFYP